MVASPVQFVMVIVALFVLGGPMVVFSIILREVIPGDGPPPSSLLLPAAALAYYVARSWVRFIETAAGFGLHTIHCRLLTTACVFSATVVHLPVATAILWHCSCTSYTHLRFSGFHSRSAQPLC